MSRSLVKGKRRRPRKRSRGPGRPRAHEERPDVRARLLDTAATLCEQRAFEEVGVREIADAAGVSPGMIRYYFGGKQGLYEALIDRVDVSLQGILTPDESGSPTRALIANYLEILGSHPEARPALLREIVQSDVRGRKRFQEQVAQPLIAAITVRLEEQIEAGELRADLDPRMAALSLLGMCGFCR